MEYSELEEAHQALRTNRQEPEFLAAKESLLQQRKELLDSAGPWDPHAFLKEMGFKSQGNRSEMLHPEDPSLLFRISSGYQKGGIRVELDKQYGTGLGSKAIREFQPMPSSPEEVYELLGHYSDRIKFYVRAQDVANYEWNYVINKKQSLSNEKTN